MFGSLHMTPCTRHDARCHLQLFCHVAFFLSQVVFCCGQACACKVLRHASCPLQELLLAWLQGARVRHRMRQPACKGLCSEILEMEHMVLALGEAHTRTPADAGLQRQLKQHLRVRRWAPFHPPFPPTFTLRWDFFFFLSFLCWIDV